MKLSHIINRKYTGVLAIMMTLFALGASKQVQGQTQQFSFTQYMDNLTPLNPAYSLLDQAGSINTMARKQWVGIDGAPTTFLLNANIPVASISGAAGVIVMNDQFAIERQTEANVYFAKAIQLGQNNYLGVSLNAGIRNYRANYSSLDSSDPTFANDVRETKPNIGFGVIYFSDWYYIGVSVPELTITSLGTASVQNNNNFKNHYYFTGAFITDAGEDFKVKPSILFSYAKGVPLITDFSGIMYIKETLGIGASYRLNEEMAGILTLNLDKFHIGYSYQFGTSSSNLGGFNMATHEVSLGYRFGKGIGKRKLL
ncbi:PorP/SprF family type IX secretion system membrane protein [Mucilaginibacter sp. FT3.2]|uniref:PorP/SprF family type IX secretion system membrane protein n=1 Tax=Mucilaginibacter sp. FT3.2 TaxID=2723090 RepID=UPI0016183A6E|nr:PorP/SprF family type IX secretion system membrane protein [Mucilaginibacter sp. FT3.2]MBB6232350.1 type IX secretion system PorP/SprF family membrane protein [Mucilaginibacter sp. FT3.2]